MAKINSEHTLLKLVTEYEAIIYRMIAVESTTAIKTVEVCRIGQGKMLINYKKPVESYIYQSDVGTIYTVVKEEECKRIFEILSNALKAVGF